ncbi:MAG: hypothetical protein M1269_02315 [Chloroflexi bacterium]|nr:hypothetical protein [Chloroflexota bacterium]
MNLKRKRKGSAVLAAIWITLVVAMLGFSLMSLCSLSTSFATKFSQDTQAFEAAQAGLADAMNEILNSSAWSSGYTSFSQINPGDLWSAGFNNKQVPGTNATYSISFGTPVPGTPYYSVNNVAGTSAADGCFGTGTVPAGTYQIISVGRSSTSNQNSARVVFASVKPSPRSVWGDFAIFANRSLTFTGHGGTDSWNSAEGTYSATASYTKAPVGTNANGSSVVSLGAHTAIGGNVQVGPGGDIDTSISEGSHTVIYGDKVVASSLLPLPNIAAPSGTNLGSLSYSGGTNTISPGTYTDITVTGQGEVILSPGTYVFTGNIQLTGQGKISVTSGQATIYVEGNVHDTGQGFCNTTRLPKNMMLIGTETCTSIHLGGNATAYMGVYAPSAQVHYNGNADFYGSIISDTFTSNGNPMVHRDVDMENYGPFTGVDMAITAWQEL